MNRPIVRIAHAELTTPYALNVLQGVGDVKSEKGFCRYVVQSSGNYFGVSRTNQPTSQEMRFPKARFDNAAEVALSALINL